MAIGDITYVSHGLARISAQYPYMFAKEILYDANAQTFFNAQDEATLGAPGGAQFANAAVRDFTRTLTTPMRGDTVQIGQQATLKGRARSGTLQNYEEKMNYSYMTIGIEKQRHAVGYDRFSQEKSFWDIQEQVRKLFGPWLKLHKDRVTFNAFTSGTTAVYDGLTVGTRASAAAAAMATAGLTVSALDKGVLTLEAKNADPLFFNSGEMGARIGGYACVMPPDQYADVMQETAMKSAIHLSVPPGPGNPLRSGAMTQYKNLYIFKLGGNFRNGGSPLQPMMKLYSAITTASSVVTAHFSTTGSAAVPTQYLESSGYVVAYDPGSTKKERIQYTVRSTYYLTIARTAGSRTSHVAANTIVARDTCKVLFFGANCVAKVETIDPEWIYETQDYKERLGQGLRWVEGYKKIDDTFDVTPGIYLLECCNDRSINIL